MKADIFNIKPYDDSLGVSILIDLYNKMKKYLNPETTALITEEATHAFLGKETVLSRDFLMFENNQGDINAIAGISRAPIIKDVWYAFYAVLPEYFKSNLPGEVIDAILNLGNNLNAPGLLFQTFGVLCAPFDEKLEKLGFNPVNYHWSMHLDDFNSVSQPTIPEGITIKNFKDLEDYTPYIAVFIEAFKDSFMFQPITKSSWKTLENILKQTFTVEYCMAYEDNKMVGGCFIQFNPEQNQIGMISNLCVLPNYQHRKIGSGLLALGIDILQKRGCKTIELSVDTENEKALSLYRRFGFRLNEKLTQKSFQIM